jgi:hypothetical protein
VHVAAGWSALNATLRRQPVDVVTGVQMAVVIIVTPDSPEKAVADQPEPSDVGPLSSMNPNVSLLTVAPPPITFMPLGQVAVARVAISPSLSSRIELGRLGGV